MKEKGWSPIIKVTKIMPITLINDTQYGFWGLCPSTELESLYVNPQCRHCQPYRRRWTLPKKKKKKKKYRPHRRIRQPYPLFGNIISWILTCRGIIEVAASVPIKTKIHLCVRTLSLTVVIFHENLLKGRED